MFHFVTGHLIFTDGKKKTDYYETTRVDEKSTNYTTIYSKFYIQPGIDVITIPDKSGSQYTQVVENGSTTNQIVGVTQSTTTTPPPIFPVQFNNGVIHTIDKVLNFSDLNTK